MPGESRVFTMARNVYKVRTGDGIGEVQILTCIVTFQACMDLDQIEEVGLDPLKTMLREMGGWPVLEGDR